MLTHGTRILAGDTGKLDCVLHAAGRGSYCVSCAGMTGTRACLPSSSCECPPAVQGRPISRVAGDEAVATTAAAHRADAGGAGAWGLSRHDRQMLALTRAILASALNGSRVLVIEGLDSLVDSRTQELLMTRQISLGMTTVLISRHAGKEDEPPPVLRIPGALAICVHADGRVRHYVGRSSTLAGGGSASAQSEASDNDHCEQYGSCSDCASEGRSGEASPLKKKRSVAGHAGKVLALPFKGIGKAGRMIGRSVVNNAPSLSAASISAPVLLAVGAAPRGSNQPTAPAATSATSGHDAKPLDPELR